MADVLLSASLQVLFERLASPELINFIRRRNLSHELLNELRRKLVVVLNVLDDAEVKQFSNPNVKEWLVHVKGAVYDAEDLLDEIATDALRCKMEAADSQTGGTLKAWKWNKFSACVKAPFAIKSMESRVRGMIALLEKIALEKVGLGLAEGGSEKRSPRPSSLISTSLEDESIVVGRDEIQKKMVKWLLSDNKTGDKLEVTSIVGMGGSGKTTLARLLYNDKGVEEHFDLKAWVCVSTEFLLINVTKTILEEIGSKTDSDSLNKLQCELQGQLSNKKFLLVLDDVWNLKPRDGGNMGVSDHQGWDCLRRPLHAAAKGSKIVVTTRNRSVATTMGAVPIHHLEELTSGDSWSLFEKHAFKGRDANAELRRIGRKIADKCQGLPLAVKALGCLLNSKKEEREWDDVLKSDIWHLSGSEILPSLRLSYHHLSLPLKHCFAYCSIFPQDHQFNKEKLILLWMAEGLLHPQQNEGRRMEEIGEWYFDELLARSFFQKSIGKKGSCFVMHDLIHELAQHVAGDFCARVEDDKLPKVSEKARHFLYFQNDFQSFIAYKNFEAIAKAKSLRTFLEVKPPVNSFQFLLSGRVLQDILPKMLCLRALSLYEYKITDLPKSIGNLKHLRYLDLSSTKIQKLPESICYLCNLQTLILTKCSRLDELPSKMGKLINLRYLDIHGCESLKGMSSHVISQLKSLQRLTQFVVGQNSGLGIGKLNGLSEIRGKLYISDMKNVVDVADALQAKMQEKRYLDELIFDWGGEHTNGVTQSGATPHDILNKLQPHRNLKQLTITNYPGVTFPNWLGDPSALNLVSLELRRCGNCSTLPPLGQLTRLKHLQISSMNGVECVGGELYGNDSFQSLETLSFKDMPNWEKWLYRGEFPHLQKLSIQKCPKLTGKLPEQLLSLVKLQINRCPRLLMASLTVPAICELRLVDFGKLQLQMSGCDLTAIQTSEIEISGVSQWKQLPVVPHQLSIRARDSMEFLLDGEILQTNIHDLGIYGVTFSRSLHSVGLPTTLKSLGIYNSWKLEFLLPELFKCRLPVLERLDISEGVIYDSLSLSFSLGIFPKLTNFRIGGLRGLKKLSIWVLEGDHTSLRSLNLERCPNLESIELHALNLESCWFDGCSKLRSLAHTHSSTQQLVLTDCPELLFQREVLPSNLLEFVIENCNQLTPQVEWGLQGLTSLTHFTIREGGCEDIELFPKECLLPSSLTYLRIAKLPNLKSLDSGGLQQLNSLLTLEIVDCPKLQFSTGSVFQHLISLKELEIYGCSRLQSLTEVGLQHLTSLEGLWIVNCPMLQSLTKVGLQRLTSLKTLDIINCRKLKYLTKERLPDSLSYLYIDECPLLEKRCQFGKGEEWRYIAHIPKIAINNVLY